jgi:putative tricarboxylic transport membrane protein
VLAPAPARRHPLTGRAELGLAALLLALGVFLLVETQRIAVPVNANAVGPRFFPMVVGAVLVVVSIWLAVDVLRGGAGEMEAAEDVDLSRGSDWRTLGLLSAVFLVHAAILEPLGFPVAAALLFFGVAASLGSRRWARDAAVAVVLAVLVFVVFARGLGVGLPVGVLQGVL